MDDKITDALNDIKNSFDEKLESYNNQVADAGKASEATRADLKAMGEDLSQIKNDLTDLQQKGVGVEKSQNETPFAQQFLNSTSFSSFKMGDSKSASMAFQNNVTTGDFNTRSEAGYMIPNRASDVLDFIQRGRTDNTSVHYFKRSVASTADAQDGDGSAKHESALDFTDVTAPVRTIASYTLVSEQALEDVAMLETYINAELRDGLRKEVEKQVIQGTGLTGQMSGWDAAGNSTSVVVTALSNVIDAASLLMTTVGGNGGDVEMFVLPYTDYHTLLITADTNNRAISPLSYVNGVATLFGRPVVPTSSCPANTLFAVGRNSNILFERSDVTVAMSNSDEDNFKKNMVTVRAESRAALIVPYADQITKCDLSTLA